MTRSLLFIFVSIFATHVKANCINDDTSFRCVKYVSAYDGDTITFNIPNVHPLFGKKISVRVRGIDTPEIATKNRCEKEAGRTAQRLVRSLLENAKQIDLLNVDRDKYFRILADVQVDGKSIAKTLLKNKLAYEYNGGTKAKQNWCDLNAIKRTVSSDGSHK
ncbi:MAG: thermonuclease family protein [Bdellovibrio sp.]|nr:thermonuclease family protein [Bdellovibrio sp.]